MSRSGAGRYFADPDCAISFLSFSDFSPEAL
jgi:hypothetical protein